MSGRKLSRWTLMYRSLRRALRPQPTQHGTLTGYRNGCRCDQCRTANSDYGRQYRARKSTS